MTKKKQVQSVVKLTKALASTSEKTREDAIVDVQLWVENTDFTKLDSTKVEEELKKIWQGLFYSYWLTDGIAKHYAASVIMAEMIHQFKDGSTPLVFLQTFYETLEDTWPKIDKHRVGKYMGLVRRFVEQSFIYLNNYQYETSIVDRFVEIMKNGPLDVNKRLNSSLACVVITYIYMSMKSAYEYLNEESFNKIIDLLFDIYAETYDVATLKMIETELFEHMIHEGDNEYWKEYEESKKHPDDDPDAQPEDDEDDQQQENGEDEELLVFPIDYKRLSDKMDALAHASTTENKQECLKWKTLFFDRFAKEEAPENILDGIEQELMDLEDQHNIKKAKKAERQEKRARKKMHKDQQKMEIEEAEIEQDEEEEQEEEKVPEPKVSTKRKRDTKENGHKSKAKSSSPAKKQAPPQVEPTPKKVLFQEEHNKTKVFQKSDIVMPSPLPVHNPKKSLLKRKLFEDGEELEIAPFNDFIVPAFKKSLNSSAASSSSNKRKRNTIKDAVRKKRKLMSL